MLRQYITLIICVLYGEAMWAIPAYPRPFSLNLDDGKEVSIRLKGDEYNKWALTTDN